MRLDRGHTAAEILSGGMAMVVENHASQSGRGLYSVHVRTRKLRTPERPLLSGSTRQPLFGFSRERSILPFAVSIRGISSPTPRREAPGAEHGLERTHGQQKDSLHRWRLCRGL